MEARPSALVVTRERLGSCLGRQLSNSCEWRQCPLDLLTDCLPVPASQPHRCGFGGFFGYHVWGGGFSLSLFLLRCGEFWRISRSVLYALGQSNTMIICLGYRQLSMCVCTNVSSIGRSVDRYFSPPPSTALCPAREKRLFFWLLQGELTRLPIAI